MAWPSNHIDCWILCVYMCTTRSTFHHILIFDRFSSGNVSSENWKIKIAFCKTWDSRRCVNDFLQTCNVYSVPQVSAPQRSNPGQKKCIKPSLLHSSAVHFGGWTVRGCCWCVWVNQVETQKVWKARMKCSPHLMPPWNSVNVQWHIIPIILQLH